MKINNVKMRVEKLLKKNEKTINFLMVLFVTIGFFISLDFVNVNKNDISNFEKVFIKINNSFRVDIFKSICIFGFVYFLSNKLYIDKNNIYKRVLALLFSIFMLIGYSYDKTNSWDLIFGGKLQFLKSFVIGTSYYIVFKLIINYIIDYIIPKIKNIKEELIKNKTLNFIFEKKSFLLPFVIILVFWLPYLIFVYPGILSPDPINQIKQFYGIEVPENSATNSTNLIDESVKITNHHPVLHTLILGSCVKIGQALIDENLGIFLYTIIQTIFLASALAYIINYMKKLKINKYIRIISLILFSILPVFPSSAIWITKDVIFVSIFIYYIIEIYNMIICKKYITKKRILLVIILGLALCLFRNNGIYTVLLSLPFIAIVNKKNRKKILIATLIIFIIYQSFIKIFLPTLKIANGGIQEMLSIPFQQTARYVKEYPDDVTEEEKVIIDKVLVYENLGKRYVPGRSDSVKGKYNKNATKEDLMEYFSVWFRQFFRHPNVYIESYINNYYGYFYIEKKATFYPINDINPNKELNSDSQFNYKYNDNFLEMRALLNGLAVSATKLPIVNWITNIGLSTWILLFIVMYLLYTRKFKYILYLLPCISILFACLASPMNAAFRYIMPNIFAMPVILSIFLNIIKYADVDKKKILK